MINFWTHVCCQDSCLADLMDLDSPNILDRFCWGLILLDKTWDVVKLLQPVPLMLLSNVLPVPIPLSDVQDRFCWGLIESGEFSIKSATWKPRANFDPILSPWKFKWIWQLDVLPKIQIFLW